MDAAGTLFVWVQGAAGTTPPLPANPGFEGTSNDIATRYGNTIAADSPVAHYRFGETGGTTAVDEIAGRNGTYVGDPLIGASGAIAGDADGAIAIGGDDGMIVGSAGAWTLSSITVEVWAKLTGSAAAETVIVRRGGSDDYEWALTRLASGALRASIRTAATTISVTSAGTYADGNYHLVALTHNGTTLRLNVDGVTVGSTSAGARPATSLPIGFGIDADGAGNGLSGSLDEAAIYGTALPESTLTAHYRAGVSAIGSTADWERTCCRFCDRPRGVERPGRRPPHRRCGRRDRRRRRQRRHPHRGRRPLCRRHRLHRHRLDPGDRRTHPRPLLRHPREC
jgi:hypothetical protein